MGKILDKRPGEQTGLSGCRPAGWDGIRALFHTTFIDAMILGRGKYCQEKVSPRLWKSDDQLKRSHRNSVKFRIAFVLLPSNYPSGFGHHINHCPSSDSCPIPFTVTWETRKKFKDTPIPKAKIISIEGDKRRKYHHWLVTVAYSDTETFGRVYNDLEKANKFAARQRKSPVVQSVDVKQLS